MPDFKKNVKDLISNIYECQKKINFANNRIQELQSEGNDTSRLQNEITGLHEKIIELQKKLRKEYHFIY